MSTESTEITPARFVNIIRFYGLILPIQAVNKAEYLPLKPLNDLIGMDWRTTKDTVQSGDNAQLFEPLWLPAVSIALGGGYIPPCKDVLHIRLDRAHMYLARINTDRIRSHGNTQAADFLLTLQLEWAKALHAYETHGIAVKPGRSHALRERHQMIRSRERLRDPSERAALTALIHEERAALGLSTDSADDKPAALPFNTAQATA